MGAPLVLTGVTPFGGTLLCDDDANDDKEFGKEMLKKNIEQYWDEKTRRRMKEEMDCFKQNNTGKLRVSKLLPQTNFLAERDH